MTMAGFGVRTSEWWPGTNEMGSGFCSSRLRRRLEGARDKLAGALSGKRRGLFLRSLDEFQHEAECWFGVRLKQEMPAVENMSLHARQILHPGQRFGDIEEWVVTAPQHERRRLPFF